MISSTEVSDHRPPLKPIDFRPVWEAAKDDRTATQVIGEALENEHRRLEAQRIWDLVKSVSEGN